MQGENLKTGESIFSLLTILINKVSWYAFRKRREDVEQLSLGYFKKLDQDFYMSARLELGENEGIRVGGRFRL